MPFSPGNLAANSRTVAVASVVGVCSACQVVEAARAGTKKSMSNWLTRSASS